MLNYQRVEYDRMEHIPKNQSCLGGGVIHFFPSFFLYLSHLSIPPYPPKKLVMILISFSGMAQPPTAIWKNTYTDPIKCKDLGYAQLGSKPLRPLDGCAMFLLPLPGPACL